MNIKLLYSNGVFKKVFTFHKSALGALHCVIHNVTVNEACLISSVPNIQGFYNSNLSGSKKMSTIMLYQGRASPIHLYRQKPVVKIATAPRTN